MDWKDIVSKIPGMSAASIERLSSYNKDNSLIGALFLLFNQEYRDVRKIDITNIIGSIKMEEIMRKSIGLPIGWDIDLVNREEVIS